MNQPKENKNQVFRQVSNKAVYLLTQKFDQSFRPCVPSCYHFALIHVYFRDSDAYSRWELSIELLQDRTEPVSGIQLFGIFL